MFLSNIDGTFEDLELVRNTANSVNATIYNVTGPLVTVEVLNKGAGYQLGDNVRLTSPVNLTDAEGIVSETDNFRQFELSKLEQHFHFSEVASPESWQYFREKFLS